MHAQTAAVALFACAPDVVVLAHAAAVAVYACSPDVLVLADVVAAADHVPRDTSKRAKRPTHLTSKKRKPVARPNTMGAACVDDESDDAGEGVGLWFDVVMLLMDVQVLQWRMICAVAVQMLESLMLSINNIVDGQQLMDNMMDGFLAPCSLVRARAILFPVFVREIRL